MPDKATRINYKLVVVATGYCACDICTDSYTLTKLETVPRSNHTIAVDPAVIPLGSKVIINGITYVAEDIGGGIKQNKIDVYFDTHEEALQFGKQIIEIEIIQ